jgi:hypothetical protein
MKKSVKRSLAIGAGVLVVVGGAWGYTTLKGATPDIDPSKLATVERGTMTRSVVATGKIEPITKVALTFNGRGSKGAFMRMPTSCAEGNSLSRANSWDAPASFSQKDLIETSFSYTPLSA